MPGRYRQLRMRNPDIFLLLPATPLAHRHARILRTIPVDHISFCFTYPDLHHGLLGSGSPASADLRPCAAAAHSVVSLAIAAPLGMPDAHSLRTPRGHALRRTDVAPGLEVSLRNILQDLLVQRQLRDQPFQLAVLLLQFFQSLRLVHLQTAVFLPPAVERLHGDLGFLAGLWGGFSVRDAHFNLPQHRHDLLWLVPLDRHDQLFLQVDSLSFHLVQKSPVTSLLVRIPIAPFSHYGNSHESVQFRPLKLKNAPADSRGAYSYTLPVRKCSGSSTLLIFWFLLTLALRVAALRWILLGDVLWTVALALIFR